MRQYIKSITVFDSTKESLMQQPSIVSEPGFQETLPHLVLANGQILNTAQIVSHNGQSLEILPAELSQLLQSGNTVQMIGQNGQTQLLQLEASGQEDCEIIMDPDIDDTQYFEDVTVTTHDDIETTEDVIHLDDEDEILEEQTTEPDDCEDNVNIIQEDPSYEENFENDPEEFAEKEYLVEFISSQVSMPMPGKYLCNLCQKEFRQYRWMENHLKSHSNWIRVSSRTEFILRTDCRTMC